MRISLIGMSGTGKSHWSSQLVTRGFERFCCDDLIDERLDHELTGEDGARLKMGEWMGFPYQQHYAEREATYLAHEIDVLNGILDYLRNSDQTKRTDLVIDTTGSVIYAGQSILEALSRYTVMVYLDTPAEVQAEMCRAYAAAPPPVLWRDKFNKNSDESDVAALTRCYPDLLASRTVQYKRWAQVTLDYHMLRQDGFSVEDFLALVKQPAQS